MSQNLVQFLTALGGVLTALVPPIAGVIQARIQTRSPGNGQPGEQGDGNVQPPPGQRERQPQWMVPTAFGSWLIAIAIALGVTFYSLVASTPVVGSSVVLELRWLAGAVAGVSITAGATGIVYSMWESARHRVDRHRADVVGGAASMVGGVIVCIGMAVIG